MLRLDFSHLRSCTLYADDDKEVELRILLNTVARLVRVLAVTILGRVHARRQRFPRSNFPSL